MTLKMSYVTASQVEQVVELLKTISETPSEGICIMCAVMEFIRAGVPEPIDKNEFAEHVSFILKNAIPDDAQTKQ